MILNDLPYLVMISDLDEAKGGEQNNYYNNRAAAVALAYADGSETLVAAGTLVYIGRGFSQSQSFSQAQSFEDTVGETF